MTSTCSESPITTGAMIIILSDDTWRQRIQNGLPNVLLCANTTRKCTTKHVVLTNDGLEQWHIGNPVYWECITENPWFIWNTRNPRCMIYAQANIDRVISVHCVKPLERSVALPAAHRLFHRPTLQKSTDMHLPIPLYTTGPSTKQGRIVTSSIPSCFEAAQAARSPCT